MTAYFSPSCSIVSVLFLQLFVPSSFSAWKLIMQEAINRSELSVCLWLSACEGCLDRLEMADCSRALQLQPSCSHCASRVKCPSLALVTLLRRSLRYQIGHEMPRTCVLVQCLFYMWVAWQGKGSLPNVTHSVSLLSFLFVCFLDADSSYQDVLHIITCSIFGDSYLNSCCCSTRI